MLFFRYPTFVAFGMLTLALAACGDNGAAKTEAAPAPFAQDTYGNCTWEHVKGSEIGIWSYNCGPNAGNVRLVADNALPGFALQRAGENGESKTPVIRIFKKDAAAPIAAVLEAVRAASPGPHTETCTLTPNQGVPGGKAFVLTPDATAAAEWEKYQTDGAGSVQPPCGALGPQFVGDSYFKVLDDDPTVVVWADLGSELPIYDVKTLHKLKN